MRLIHLADLHLGYYPKSVEVNPNIIEGGHIGLRRFITGVTLRNLNKAIDYAIDEGINLMVISGDVFEDVDSSLLYSMRFAEALEKLVENKIYTVIIAGNHDAQVRRMKRASLALFSRDISEYIRYVDVYSTAVLARYIERGGYSIEYNDLDVSIIPLPYTYSAENWRTYVRRYVEKSVSKASGKYRVLAAHIQVDRVKFSAMYGDKAEEMINIDTLTLTDIRPDLFNYVALGHIHLMQRLGLDNVYYSGSLNKLRFDEALDKKFFLNVELGDGLKVNPIEVDTVKMYYETVILDRYSTVEDVVNEVIERMGELSNALVKVRFKYFDKSLYKKWSDSIRSRLKKVFFDGGVAGFNIEFRFEGEPQTLAVGSGAAPSEIDVYRVLREYIDNVLKDKPKEYRDEVFKEAVKYIEGVRENA